jgi:hypothetical protein
MRLVKPYVPEAGADGGHRPRSVPKDIYDGLPKSRWSYIPLVCGHLSTPEREFFWYHWRPKRKPGKNFKSFCEICGKWKDRQPPPKPAEIPAEPLF